MVLHAGMTERIRGVIGHAPLCVLHRIQLGQSADENIILLCPLLVLVNAEFGFSTVQRECVVGRAVGSHNMHDVTVASAATSAALTVGLAVYAALILAAIAVVIDGARRHQRSRAIAAGVVVGVLTLGGLVAAIVSSVA